MSARRLAPLAAPLGLAALTVWLGFEAGGFFAGTTGLAAVLAGVALVVWAMVAVRPFEGVSPLLGLAVAALTAFALWTLVSQAWSDAPARALLEFDRALLYVLAVTVVGAAAVDPRTRRTVPHAIAAAFAVICICGLVTRLLPELWSATPAVQRDRLSFPVTYWNVLAAIAAIGIVCCLHLAACAREAVAVRALAAAAIPPVAVTLLLTFSRGGLLIAALGVVVYLLLARPAGAVAALLATAPAAAAAVLVAYRADHVVDPTGGGSAVVAEGRTVALVVLGCAIAAGLLVVALRRLDARAAALARRPAARPVALATGAVAVVAAIAVAFALGVPGRVSDELGRLGDSDLVAESGDRRDHLTDFGDSGRVDHWRVGLDAFAARPLSGEGAGMYAVLWDRDRASTMEVTDAHSLYVEVLAELGLVGLGLLLVAIVALLVAAARAARGPQRALGAVGFAVLLMWALHAGIDWDWEMPALTLPALALGAAVAARERTRAAVAARGPWPGRVPRLIGALALLAVLWTPLSIARSQWQLDDAVAAMRDDRCTEAIDAALASNRALSIRPEPFQVLTVCDARLGEGELALAAVEAAHARDPRNWRLTYGVGVVRAALGRDPRPMIRRALRQNPNSGLVNRAADLYDTDRPAAWRRASGSTPLPF